MSLSGIIDGDVGAKPDLKTAIELFEAVRTELARQKGRRDGLLERQDELIDKVGIAKARVGMKGDIEQFISDLQAEAFAQATHSLETLLTSIVQEVLPASKPIGLELGTERGLPALDISVVGPGGTREDIYEDHGGSLSNVVVMGLRLIAAVKAGGARFLALDEPECWVKPERVPAFFGVLRDACRRLDMQAIAITHHSASANFDASVRISEVMGRPEDGTTIEANAPIHDWRDDAKGFRWIRLINFQAFADAIWHLTPGLNALIGENDHGKSCVIRALRAVFYGEGRDKHIRHFANGCVIQIGIEGKRYLQFSRELKRNPKNIWSLHEEDGAVVVVDDKRYETGGKEVPDWVDRMWGITKKDDNETHIAHQKRPVYLIDKPDTQKASVLSIGQESAYTTDMLKIAKERIQADNATIKAGEAEVGTIKAAIEKMTVLAEAEKHLAEADHLLAEIQTEERKLQAIGDHLQRIKDAQAALRAARMRQAIYADIPTPEQIDVFRQRLDRTEKLAAIVENVRSTAIALTVATERRNAMAQLPEAAPQFENTQAIFDAIGEIRQAGSALAQCEVRKATLQALPTAPPGLTSTIELANAIANIRFNQEKLASAQTNKAHINTELETVKTQIDQALAAGGNRCPTCGHAVTGAELLHHHGQVGAA